MSGTLSNRLKRLETSRGDEYRRAYMLGLERCKTTEEWLEQYASEGQNQITELKPLQKRSYVRSYAVRPRKCSLSEALEQAGASQLWICSDIREANSLLADLVRASPFSHAFVFTDLQDEMGLGPSRHRMDQ